MTLAFRSLRLEKSCRLKLLLACVAGVLWAVAPPLARSQDVIIDWQDKKYTSGILLRPAEIGKGQSVAVEVRGVNNILYDYTVNVELVVGSNADDLAQILGMFPTGKVTRPSAPPALVAPPCDVDLASAEKQFQEIGDYLVNPKNNLNPEDPPKSGKYVSILVKDSVDSWKNRVERPLKDLQQTVARLQGCANASGFLKDKYEPFATRMADLQKKVESAHIKSAASVTATGFVTQVKVTVKEIYKDKERPVREHTYVLNYSSVMTLSGGVLFSMLQDRSYVRRKLPTATGSTDVLGIDGGSRPVPMFVGLLNYKNPYLDKFWDTDKLGLAISSGPTIRVGGAASDVSHFGYFAGLSLHLWNRFFITPGLHVGQFADFPVGFVPGQSIPPNFGELTPVKRWTARFAIGITYKTNDLGPLTGKSASGGGTPKKSNSQ